MVRQGACCISDFRDIFKNNIERRVQSLPDIPGLTKDAVVSSWMSKFDQICRGDEDPRRWSQQRQAATSEAVLSKEQLYDMFQHIVHIKKYEHQILYNAIQVSEFESCILDIGVGMIFPLWVVWEQKLVKNNQDNQIQNITLCSLCIF